MNGFEFVALQRGASGQADDEVGIRVEATVRLAMSLP